MQFDLVSPERKLVSVQASSVQIPGIHGDFTAMPNHAPFLTTLRPGVIKVNAPGEVSEYVVTGGFAEISPEATTILAEMAMPRAEASVDLISELVKEAETGVSEAAESDKIAAGQRLRDVNQLRSALGL
jgi:F-type H+-transporting ATPase subunit epsilon